MPYVLWRTGEQWQAMFLPYLEIAEKAAKSYSHALYHDSYKSRVTGSAPFGAWQAYSSSYDHSSGVTALWNRPSQLVGQNLTTTRSGYKEWTGSCRRFSRVTPFPWELSPHLNGERMQAGEESLIRGELSLPHLGWFASAA